MEVFARRRYADMSAQKCRLVADQIRGLPVDKALNMLKFNQRKAAAVIRKLLESAIANAEHNEGADIDELKVSTVFVDEGPTAKRWHARARGRSSKIFKRSSHITIAVSDKR